MRARQYKVQQYNDARFSSITCCTRVLRFELDRGCAAQASKPIPVFKGDFGQKGYPFLRIFLQK